MDKAKLRADDFIMAIHAGDLRKAQMAEATMQGYLRAMKDIIAICEKKRKQQ